MATGYQLTTAQSKAVQVALSRYLDTLRTNIEVFEEENETVEDIDGIEELVKLFDD